MSFPILYSQITQKNTIIKLHTEKEEDSAKTQPITSYFPRDGERASLFTSFRGGIVVEASLVIPIFFFAVCCLCFLLEVMAVQVSVRAAAHSVAKQIVKEAYAVPLVLPSKVESDIVETIGADRLDRSIVRDGSAGLDCSRTAVSPGSGILYMNVQYEIMLPFLMFGRLELACEDKFQMKGWVGYTEGGFLPGREEMVYITENGLVYHRDYHCTYLDLSIQRVRKEDIENMRNMYGGKYYACERCGHASGGSVYITSQGNRYHSSLSCGGLKRSVYSVPISEVMGKGACSRCGH